MEFLGVMCYLFYRLVMGEVKVRCWGYILSNWIIEKKKIMVLCVLLVVWLGLVNGLVKNGLGGLRIKVFV